LVFGVFALLFFVKHAVVLHSLYDVRLLPEPFHHLELRTAYYLRTASGATELLLIFAGFAATFWLNLPKHYFAVATAITEKERASAEAKSVAAAYPDGPEPRAALSPFLLSISRLGSFW